MRISCRSLDDILKTKKLDTTVQDRIYFFDDFSLQISANFYSYKGTPMYMIPCVFKMRRFVTEYVNRYEGLKRERLAMKYTCFVVVDVSHWVEGYLGDIWHEALLRKLCCLLKRSSWIQHVFGNRVDVSTFESKQ